MNACLSRTVSLSDRVGSKFPPHAMVHGLTCHGRGVELREIGPERVRARVRSQRVHDVELRAEPGKLVIVCSCPGRSLEIVGCQHAWAVLLEVDKRGGLEALRTTPGPIALVAEAPKPTPKTAKAKPGVKSASRRSPRATAAPPAPQGKPRKRRPRP